jgi:hypothetical protein
MYEGFPPRDPLPEPGERRWQYVVAVLVAIAVVWTLLSSLQPTGDSGPPTPAVGTP